MFLCAKDDVGHRPLSEATISNVQCSYGASKYKTTIGEIHSYNDNVSCFLEIWLCVSIWVCISFLVT